MMWGNQRRAEERHERSQPKTQSRSYDSSLTATRPRSPWKGRYEKPPHSDMRKQFRYRYIRLRNPQI